MLAALAEGLELRGRPTASEYWCYRRRIHYIRPTAEWGSQQQRTPRYVQRAATNQAGLPFSSSFY